MAKSKILVVEDHSDACGMLCALLEMEGFEVRTAENGAVAVKVLENFRPALIVTDWVMPVFSGEELIRFVREQAELTHIPIVVLSAFKKEFYLAARRSGATEVLEKPAGVSQLVRTIKRLLDGENNGEYPEIAQGWNM